MLGIFKKKQQEAPALPIDKAAARQGFTSTVRIFADAQQKLGDADASIFLYVQPTDSPDKCLILACSTFLAGLGDALEDGLTIYFTEDRLGDDYDSFLQSSVSKLFRKGKGETPEGYKGIYYVRDFGYDAEAVSAVIVLLLEEVFHLRPEEVCMQIQLLSFEGATAGKESTVTFDADGSRVASSGFDQDLF